MSQLAGCVTAANLYLVSEVEAREIIDHQVTVIESNWTEVADQAQLPTGDRENMWHRQFLNPYAFECYVAG